MTAPPRRAPAWLVAVTAIGLVLGSFALVIRASQDLGIARDEAVYMSHGSRYATWWTDLLAGKSVTSEKKITATWGGKEAVANNREHPPLMKTLFGFSHKLLHEQLGWASEQTAYRAPTALLWAGLIAMVFLFTCSIWGYAEGLVAALLTLLLPRAFFHAGLACFDAPIAALWFATVVAYYKALSSRLWCVGLGLVFGLALATKHNAIILPSVVIAHYAFVAFRWRRGQVTASRLRAFGGGLIRRRPLAIIAMLLLGPLVLLGLWPWLWLAPIDHASDWISFHLHHTHYNFEYLGDNWNAPTFPWHVAIVTTLLTVPVVTLAAGGLGAAVLAVRARRGQAAEADRAPGLLLFLSLGASMGPFFLGSTPIFGAEKHWQPAITSICIAAGIGLVWAGRRAAAAIIARAPSLRARVVEGAAIAMLGGLAVLASAAETAASHPYGLTHYNALAGGAPGGADLGMNRQFWGVSARGVLRFLDSQPAGKVYSHDASPAWGYYQKWGLLSRDYPDSGSEYRGGITRSQYAIVVHELHFNRHDYLIWDAYGTVQPVLVLRAAGVPIVSVYRRP